MGRRPGLHRAAYCFERMRWAVQAPCTTYQLANPESREAICLDCR